MIRAALVTAVAFLLILILLPLLLVYSVLARETDTMYRTAIRCVRLVVWLAGVRMDIQGLERIPRDRAVVFMPNHQGNADPPALFAVLPPMLALAKKELFSIPILGRAMRMRGFIPVDRKNRERAVQAVEEAVVKLKDGYSFIAFPEGTRSRDGRLQPFKKGVFVMAIKAGVPVVPVSVSGSSKIMQKGSPAIRPGRMRITVHDAISTEGLTLDDREKLSREVRAAVLKGLSPDELPLGESEGT
jgi:1-acyl-sn-glycerol-3-phosphate acyltransferase